MTERTEKLLREMKLTSMADAYAAQRSNTTSLRKSFEDRFAELVEQEYDSRYNHTVAKYIKAAGFPDSSANLKDINYRADRNLDIQVIEELRSNSFIEQGLNVILTGASGCGKTWISCALGVNACLARYRVYHTRLSDYITDCEAAKMNGSYKKHLKHMNKYDLVILDDFLLSSPESEAERMNILDLIDSRNRKKSLIICSQWEPAGWHTKLGGGPVADATMDRIVNSSYIINLAGKSLREEYSPIKHK